MTKCFSSTIGVAFLGTAGALFACNGLLENDRQPRSLELPGKQLPRREGVATFADDDASADDGDGGTLSGDAWCTSNGPDAWPDPGCTCDLAAMHDMAGNTCQGRDWCLTPLDAGCSLHCLQRKTGAHGRYCSP